VSTDHRPNEHPRDGFRVHYDRDGKAIYMDLPSDFDESDRAVLNEILTSLPKGSEPKWPPNLALIANIGADEGHRPHPR
jgi:hypothetical protein